MTETVDLREWLINETAIAEGTTPADILAAVDFYNADYSAYDNSIYNNISTRLAHWVNYRDRGWFTKRIELVLKSLKESRNALLVDIGFSISYLKASGEFSERTDLSTLLVEKFESAAEFHALLKKALPETRDLCDHLLLADVDTPEGCKSVVDSVFSLVESHAHATDEILISAIEVVEHLEHIPQFWKMCAEIEKRSGLPTRLYVTLPICDSIPSHTAAFRTQENAVTYLRAYMDVDHSVLLSPPNHIYASSFLKGCVCVFGSMRSE
jgi:hypothetical protein